MKNMKILHRLNITLGHLKKVIEMHNNGAYCIDVLHQLEAIRAAIGKTESAIMENHLNTCVYKSFMSGKRDQAIKEVLTVFEKSR